MKIALVGMDNYKGLGTLTREWCEHMPVTKLFVRDNSKGVLGGARVGSHPREQANWLTSDVDVLISLETPFPNIFKMAQVRGIKTVLKVNYEFLSENLKYEPDLYLCSSDKNYQAVQSSDKELIPDPVNCNKIDFHQRKEAKTFLHNAGTGGMHDANGTQELLEAMQYVESDIELVIRHQEEDFDVDDDRITVENTTYENYWDMYGKEYDVFVSPQKFRATSLPIQEALASGMSVLSTDIAPFDEQATWTVEPGGYETTTHSFHRPVNLAIIEPKKIAKKIDKIAGKNIEKESKKARQYAESISWSNFKKQLCQTLSK